MSDEFRALVLEEDEGKVSASVQMLDDARLPDGDVTVDVAWSDLNYKDGMVLKGIGRLVRNYPHVPGIDFAGTVSLSDSPDFKPGDKVVLTGWRVGEAHWGGYAERARVKSDWLVPLPDGLSEKDAMTLGTAGFTAMLSVMALAEHGVTPDSGPVLVTGGGGVGGVAIALLAAHGYEVHASTGRAELADYLTGLGAGEIVPRAELAELPKRPLASERWAGAIDAVGGNTLAALLTQIKYGGAVAACGLAGGAELSTTVLPFLLRGVNLLGIDSVMCPGPRRVAAWAAIADKMPRDALGALAETATLEDLPGLADKILKGGVRGRVIIDPSSVV
ncbi:MAG: MDR family oxidoreductase [Alphaproteobacteria bacterium]